MKKAFATLGLVALSGPVALVACTSSQVGDPVSSIDSRKGVQTLSDAELFQHCKEVHAYLNSQVSAIERQKEKCLADAAYAVADSPSGRDSQAECQSLYIACMSRPADADTFTAACGSAPSLDVSNRYASCALRVGEFDQCVIDLVAAHKNKVATYDSACSRPEVVKYITERLSNPVSCGLGYGCPLDFSVGW